MTSSLVLHCLPEFAQIHVHWVGGAIQPSHPLPLLSPLTFHLSHHQSLHWVGFSHQVVKVLKLQHQFYEYSGLVFSRIDWFYLLGVQRTLKSPLQHHRLTASILQHSAFFMVQLPCPYMTTGKAIALTRWTFDGKVMSLLFNMLSRFVIAFLPRSGHLFISWLQSLSTVIWGPPK